MGRESRELEQQESRDRAIGHVCWRKIAISLTDRLRAVDAPPRNSQLVIMPVINNYPPPLVWHAREMRIRQQESHLTYCLCSDCDRLIRFCGSTRMTPLRGLSMSAMSKNAIATTNGKTVNSRVAVRCAL